MNICDGQFSENEKRRHIVTVALENSKADIILKCCGAEIIYFRLRLRR